MSQSGGAEWWHTVVAQRNPVAQTWGTGMVGGGTHGVVTQTWSRALTFSTVKHGLPAGNGYFMSHIWVPDTDFWLACGANSGSMICARLNLSPLFTCATTFSWSCGVGTECWLTYLLILWHLRAHQKYTRNAPEHSMKHCRASNRVEIDGHFESQNLENQGFSMVPE